MWWSRLSGEGRPIATRLRRLILALWALLLLVSVVTIAAMQAQTQEVDRLTLVIGPAYNANVDVLQAMTDAEAGLLSFQATGDMSYLKTYRAEAEPAAAALERLRKTLARTRDDEGSLAQHAKLEARQQAAVAAWWGYARRTDLAVVGRKSTDLAEGETLFLSFRATNAKLSGLILPELARSRVSARANLTHQRGIVIGVCLFALLVGLVGGRRAARSFAGPIGELRSVVRRQRDGDLSARARVDAGALEVRSLAQDFNALSEQNLDLQRAQDRSLRLNGLTLEIARAIRSSSGTQQALDLLCTALGEGLEVDRVMANTVDAQHRVQLGAQWHLPDLPPLGEIPDAMIPHVGQLANELWRSSEHLALDDLLLPQVDSADRALLFRRETGARALMIVPIGFGERVIGVIYCITVHEPHAWTKSEANAVQQVAGFVGRIIVQADDAARQREYVDRLERLDSQKTDFLATVSHELRTPLTSISGYLEMLQDGDAGRLTPEQAGMLEVMYRNTARLGGLIDDLLVLNRIEAGGLLMDAAGVSMRQLITQACHQLSPVALRAAVDLRIDAGPREAIVRGDKASLGRAVTNIVSNAIKFSRSGGIVTIRCGLDASGRRVLVTCQDRGIGIPSDEQGQLFTRFYRASNAVAQAIPGTGLGLTIVKQVVEDHDGQLRLSSIEGDGTEVVLDLPLLMRAPTSTALGNDSHAAGVFGIRA